MNSYLLKNITTKSDMIFQKNISENPYNLKIEKPKVNKITLKNANYKSAR